MLNKQNIFLFFGQTTEVCRKLGLFQADASRRRQCKTFIRTQFCLHAGIELAKSLDKSVYMLYTKRKHRFKGRFSLCNLRGKSVC